MFKNNNNPPWRLVWVVIPCGVYTNQMFLWSYLKMLYKKHIWFEKFSKFNYVGFHRLLIRLCSDIRGRCVLVLTPKITITKMYPSPCFFLNYFYLLQIIFWFNFFLHNTLLVYCFYNFESNIAVVYILYLNLWQYPSDRITHISKIDPSLTKISILNLTENLSTRI